MMIVPVYNQVILPDSNIFFPLNRIKATGAPVPGANEKVMFLFQKKPEQRFSEDSFWPIGVVGYVSDTSVQGIIIIRTVQRVNVENVFVRADHSLSVNISRRPDINDLDPGEEKMNLEEAKESLKKILASYQWGNYLVPLLNHVSSLSEIVCMVSQWINITPEEKYRLAAEDSRKKRNEKICEVLFEYLEIAKVTTEAQSAQNEEMKNAYRESAIKKQMEYLQKELDDMHPENVTDLRRLELRVQESHMNADARKEADKVLARLKQDGKNSPEYGMLYDYLDFITGLQWDHSEPQTIDLKEAQQVLEEDHFGLEQVKKRIIQQIAVMNLKMTQSGSILLFVGAPGTGKTSIGQSIARALQRKYVRVSLGGSRDEADIRGHRRTYIGAMPGRIMDGIAKSGVSNPVMVLDEVDKLSVSLNGDPSSALLEVLDPEQNRTFTDHYMNVPYDLSDVLFICTANTTDTIPQPLLDRMEVIRFNGYTIADKFQIARRHLLPRAMEKTGISPDRIDVSDEAVKEAISAYTMEGGVRGLKKVMETLCRSAAVEIASDKNAVVHVTAENLRDFLETRPIHHEKVTEQGKAGIVTGLAWTPVGGEILFVETMFTKGNGKITVTGQLGDVMRESAQIAISLVRNMFPEKADLFEKNDLHIHVPSGAVKKDGPSAGITLVTALSALVSEKAVSPAIAMTGEVSLRGQVMPIGGLPEKLMAAERAGVRTVLIPKDNEEDLRDVPEEIREKLEIIPVKEIKDVLKLTGILHDFVPGSISREEQDSLPA